MVTKTVRGGTLCRLEDFRWRFVGGCWTATGASLRFEVVKSDVVIEEARFWMLQKSNPYRRDSIFIISVRVSWVQFGQFFIRKK
jgi:hypothetical protein